MDKDSNTAIKNDHLIAAASTTPSRNYDVESNLTKTATIVIQLSGELANNLHHIAHGIGLQQLAKDKYGIDANLVLRHFVGPNNRAPKPKWKAARDDIRQCFPTLAQWDITRGNSKDFDQRKRLQEQWLGQGTVDHLTGLVNSANPSSMTAVTDSAVTSMWACVYTRLGMASRTSSSFG